MIEFEITAECVAYEHVRELIDEICQEHEGKRDLNIRVNLVGVYLNKPHTDKVAPLNYDPEKEFVTFEPR